MSTVRTSASSCTVGAVPSNHHSPMEVAAVPDDSWNFEPSETLLGLASMSVRGVLAKIKAEMAAGSAAVGGCGGRPVIPMGHGDPSAFPCFRTAPEAVDAVAGSLLSGEYHSYSAGVSLDPARS